jgi:hypothetical protein
MFGGMKSPAVRRDAQRGYSEGVQNIDVKLISSIDPVPLDCSPCALLLRDSSFASRFLRSSRGSGCTSRASCWPPARDGSLL